MKYSDLRGGGGFLNCDLHHTPSKSQSRNVCSLMSARPGRPHGCPYEGIESIMVTISLAPSRPVSAAWLPRLIVASQGPSRGLGRKPAQHRSLPCPDGGAARTGRAGPTRSAPDGQRLWPCGRLILRLSWRSWMQSWCRGRAVLAATLGLAACSESPTSPPDGPDAEHGRTSASSLRSFCRPGADWGLFFQSFNQTRSLTARAIQGLSGRERDDTEEAASSLFR